MNSFKNCGLSYIFKEITKKHQNVTNLYPQEAAHCLISAK